MRELVIRKVTGGYGVKPSSLARELGVSRASVYRWLKAASVEPQLEETDDHPVPPPGPIKMKRPQDWSPEEKLAAVLEAATLSDEEIGVFLRRKGLHETHLKQWREQMLAGLNPSPLVQAKKKEPESKRVRALERELRRKEKALAETAVLLVLKKKAQEIWGDEDDDTNS